MLCTMQRASSSSAITKRQLNPPAADFNASPAGGVPPLEVFFENLSTGDYDTCKWDFGGGLGSEVCDDPSMIFTEEGDHTVSSTVKGGSWR